MIRSAPIHPLDDFDMKPAVLRREWRVCVQSPLAGIERLLEALGREIPLAQGAYDNCTYVRSAGMQRFRALEGSHAGAEGTIQTTEAAEVVFTIPPDPELLSQVFEAVFAVHVNEEPTIQVEEVWGSRSKYLDDKDNPDRYWNRPDAEQIHGTASPSGG